MESLHIKNLEVRYHLSAERLSQRERLDRLLGEVLDGALEQALGHAGISPRDEICIRKMHLPIRLRTSSPDQTVVMNWSLAIANHLQEIITQNDPGNIIRYSSRLHGLIDFATGVATGDYSGAWAWHQLGFIREIRITSDLTAAEALIDAFLQEPVWIIPTLRTLAQSNQFQRIIGRIPERGWMDLAWGALTAHGVDFELPSMMDAPDRGALFPNDPVLSAIVSRIVSQSAFSATLRNHPYLFAQKKTIPWVVAVLVILDTEPAMLSRSDHETLPLVKLTAAALQALAASTGSADPESATSLSIKQDKKLPIGEQPGKCAHPKVGHKGDGDSADAAQNHIVQANDALLIEEEKNFPDTRTSRQCILQKPPEFAGDPTPLSEGM